MGELGRLKRVDLRSTWQSEAQDFTPWLAGGMVDALHRVFHDRAGTLDRDTAGTPL